MDKSMIPKRTGKEMVIQYFKNILISIDQGVNVLAGGDPDMTISARLGRNYKGSWMARFVDWLFQWQGRPTGHVDNANNNEWDEGRDAIIAKIKKWTGLA